MLLSAELLYEHPPTIPAGHLQNRLTSVLPSAKLISKAGEDEPILIAHENHVFEFKDGQKVHALTAIARGNPVDPARFTAALHQTFDWPEARQVVARASHQLVVAEMMARVFEPSARVKMFYNVLLQLVEIAPPLAIHCHHSERILNPAKVIEASGSSNDIERMSPFLNVRLFRISNGQDGELLMDTRGLAALGLPDLQIHFRNLEAGRVAGLLYNSALYIYSNGDCIKDGHTIQGLGPDQKWRCRHEAAILAPKRIVIDLDPGDPFAAGERHR
jgi:hypothetical protein